MSFWEIFVSKLCQFTLNGVIWTIIGLEQGLQPVTATRIGHSSHCSGSGTSHQAEWRNQNWRAAERHRRAAPMPIALHAWPHLPLQLDAGSRRAPLYRWSSLCIGAGHTNGPIRFRQQLSSSTSGSAPSLRRQVQRIRGCVFSGHEEAVLPKADRQSRFRQQSFLFWVDFFSGQDGIMQQGRTYNHVPGRASRAQGHPQGAPLREQTGQDIQADRSVSVNNPPLLPLATF